MLEPALNDFFFAGLDCKASVQKTRETNRLSG